MNLLFRYSKILRAKDASSYSKKDLDTIFSVPGSTANDSSENLLPHDSSDEPESTAGKVEYPKAPKGKKRKKSEKGADGEEDVDQRKPKKDKKGSKRQKNGYQQLSSDEDIQQVSHDTINYGQIVVNKC